MEKMIKNTFRNEIFSKERRLVWMGAESRENSQDQQTPKELALAEFKKNIAECETPENCDKVAKEFSAQMKKNTETSISQSGTIAKKNYQEAGSEMGAEIDQIVQVAKEKLEAASSAIERVFSAIGKGFSALGRGAYDVIVKNPTEFWTEFAKDQKNLIADFWSDVARQGVDEVKNVARSAKEHGVDIPVQFWTEVCRNTYNSDSFEMIVGLADLGKEVVVSIPAEYWTQFAKDVAEGTKQGTTEALAFLDKHIVDVPTAFWTQFAKDVVKGTKQGTTEALAFLDKHVVEIPKEFWTQFAKDLANDTLELAKATGKGISESAKQTYAFLDKHILEIPKEFWTEFGQDVATGTAEQYNKAHDYMVALKNSGVKAADLFLAEMQKRGESKLGRSTPESKSSKETQVAQVDQVEGGILEMKEGTVLAKGGLRIRSVPGKAGKESGYLATNVTVKFDSNVTQQERDGYIWKKLQDKDAWVAVYNKSKKVRYIG